MINQATIRVNRYKPVDIRIRKTSRTDIKHSCIYVPLDSSTRFILLLYLRLDLKHVGTVPRIPLVFVNVSNILNCESNYCRMANS